MNKKVKYLVIILAVFAVLISGFYFFGKSLLNSDMLKQKIEHLVEDNTGRELSIKGPLHIRILPWPRVSVTGLTLSNPAGFDQAQPFMECNSLKVDVALWPLLTGKVNFKQVTIEGAQVNLVILASGGNNWAMTSSRSPVVEDNSAQKNNKKPNHLMGALPNVVIKNSTIRMVNYKTQVVSHFTNVNWAIKPGFIKQTMTLDGIYSNQKTHQTAPINLKVVNTIKQKQIFNLVVLFRSEISQEKNNQTTKLPLQLNSCVTFNNKTKDLEVKRFQMILDQLNFNASLKTNLLNTQQISGTIALKPFDAHAFASRLGGKKYSGQPMMVSFDSRWSKDHYKLAIDGIKGQLGGGDFSGYVHLMQGAKPSFNFDIQAAKVDLGAWQSKKKTEKQKPINNEAPKQVVHSTSQVVSKPTHLSTEALSGSGRIAIKQLLANHLEVNNILIKVTANQGDIRIEMPQADVYSGRIQALLQMNHAKNTMDFSSQWSHIALEDLQKAMDKKMVLAGHADGKVEVSAPLSNADTHLNLINGSGNLKITDGQLVSKGSIQAINDAQPSAPAVVGSDGKIRFDSFNTAFKINQGVVDNYLVDLKSPKLLVKGSGTISLLDKSYKYRLDFSKSAEKMPVPVLITGILDGGSKPHVKVNAKKLVHQLIEKRRERREEGGSAGGGIFNGRLRNLLNR